MDKQVRTWWDLVTLEKYVGNNMTPRRLRWDVNSNDGLGDKELMDKWYSFFFQSIRKKVIGCNNIEEKNKTSND